MFKVPSDKAKNYEQFALLKNCLNNALGNT